MYLIGYWHFNVVVYKTVKVIRTDYALEPFQCTLYHCTELFYQVSTTAASCPFLYNYWPTTQSINYEYLYVQLGER